MKTITKHIIRGVITFALTGIMVSTGIAANLPSDNGYWVVETNAKTKNFTVLKFYNQAGQLVYEERLEGVYLDIRLKKNVKMLNRILQMVTGKTLVASQMKPMP
jgi:hypothetical protein